MAEHQWDVDPATAKSIQTALVQNVSITDFSDPIRIVAGADVSVTADREILIGGFAVFDWRQLEQIDSVVASQPVMFPYIPGLLSFREIPVLLAAWSQLMPKPDLIFCDGQGIAHPRGLGLASHLGLLLKHPTIGCAKSRLVGEYGEIQPIRGSWTPLIYNKTVVGSVLRTRDGVKPVFVSPGHQVGLDQARELVLAACTKYRLPEPIRAAHRLVNNYRRTL
jgi:deoxyribonuclease V